MDTYNLKTVYLGIDVHKKTYSVTAICDGVVMKKSRMHAEPEALIRYCGRYFPQATIISAYEAGFCGFHLHRVLVQAGIDNRVIHAASIEIAARDRVKTDKRDSLKIATQLSVGRLHAIHVPSIEREQFRSLTRLRLSLVKQRSRVACQMKNILFQFGYIPYTETKRVSQKWIEGILKKERPKEIAYCLEEYASCWQLMTQKIKEVEVELQKQAEADALLDAIYQSHPGVGPTSSRILANELGDMSQFPNERYLFSYAGLTPSQHSSGEHTRLGHISRQGKGILRKILIQIAWTAIDQDESLREIFERIAVHAGCKRAIVAVARRIIGRMRACLRKREFYTPSKDKKI